VFFDQCANELVLFDTHITQVTADFTDSGGNLHVLYHATQTGNGVGQVTGAAYRMVAVQTVTETDRLPDDGTTHTVTSTLHVRGAGRTVDELAHTTFHYALVDGELKATVDNVSFECS